MWLSVVKSKYKIMHIFSKWLKIIIIYLHIIIIMLASKVLCYYVIRVYIFLYFTIYVIVLFLIKRFEFVYYNLPR